MRLLGMGTVGDTCKVGFDVDLSRSRLHALPELVRVRLRACSSSARGRSERQAIGSLAILLLVDQGEHHDV